MFLEKVKKDKIIITIMKYEEFLSSFLIVFGFGLLLVGQNSWLLFNQVQYAFLFEGNPFLLINDSLLGVILVVVGVVLFAYKQKS